MRLAGQFSRAKMPKLCTRCAVLVHSIRQRPLRENWAGFDAFLRRGWRPLSHFAELTWFGGCSYKEPIFRHR
jgi:hypothetical protein